MLKNPKNPVKLPNTVVLVRVKYKNRAPINVRRSPKSFSAIDSQKVSPSLKSNQSFPSKGISYLNQQQLFYTFDFEPGIMELLLLLFPPIYIYLQHFPTESIFLLNYAAVEF